MTIATVISSGATARPSSAISIAAGASIVIFTDTDLSGTENITLTRSYDGGSNYRAVKGKAVCDVHNSEGRIYGPLTNGKLSITATSGSVVVYSDA